MKTFIRSYLLAALLAVLFSGSVYAQVYDTWHRPIDISYRQFRSPHFRLIFQVGLHGQAEEMAVLLEHSLPELRASVGLTRDFHIPVVLNRFTDISNGFVTSIPFRQEIEAFRIHGKSLSPRFDSWFETVAPHELAHAAHAESGSGFGFGWMLRRLGPDLARSLNLAGPRGINEGFAVWSESRIRHGAGRLHYPLFQMEFRAAMLSDDPWSLAQMLEASAYTLPYDRYYHGGAYLFNYFEERDGTIEFFRRARDFFYRFPLLGYGPALWYGTGMKPHVLGQRLRRYYQAEARRFVDALGPISRPDILASRRGDVYHRPIWVNDSTLIVYGRGYHRRPGFYRVDAASGEMNVVSNQSITEDFHYSLTPDGKGLLFSRYVPNVFEAIRSIAEVFHLDLASGETTRLTTGGRAFGPVNGVDGTIWALRNVAQSSELISIRSSDSLRDVHSFGPSVPLAVVPSPDNREVAVLVNRFGQQFIAKAAPEDGCWSLDPWLGFPDGSIFDISWSSDGQYLLFSADFDGVANIYAWERSSDLVYKLTNVRFGAIEPSLSPDGSTIAFVNYRHERFDLVTLPFDPDSASIVSDERMLRDSALAWRGGNARPPCPGGWTAGPATAGGRAINPATVNPATTRPATTNPIDTGRGDTAPSPSDYRPLLSIRPRVAYPFLLYQLPSEDEGDTSLGPGVGVGVEWSDPLQYWTAHTSAFYQKGMIWGRLQLSSGQFLLRPSVQAFRSPSTVVVRRVDAAGRIDTVRVGRDVAGVGLGLRLPAVFESNVFQTVLRASVTGEVRRERLFDDGGETIRPADDRITLSPSLSIGYRMQANPRDIVPNSGISLDLFSRLDAWAERGRPARYLQARGTVFLPFLRESSTGLALRGSLHAQNQGGIVDLTSFFPRGYDTEPAFLDTGVYAKVGFEWTQPLWYIDDGFLIPPLYFKALFAYGFIETMDDFGASDAADRLTVAGVGLGLQLRFWHQIDVTIRAAPVYRFRTNDWSASLR